MAVPKTTETTTQATPSLHLFVFLPHVDVPSNLIAKLTDRFHVLRKRCKDGVACVVIL